MNAHSSSHDRRQQVTVLIGPIGMPASWWDDGGAAGLCAEYPDDLRDLGDWVAQLSDIAAEVDLVGVGSGALVAASGLVRRPDQVRSAVLICADLAGVEFDALAATDASAQGVERLLAQWFAPNDLRTNAPGVLAVCQTLRAMGREKQIQVADALGRLPPVPAAAVDATRRPVTLVAAVHDSVSGDAWAHEWHAAVDHSRLEIWQGAHALPLQRPECLQLILDRHKVWAPYGTRVDEPLRFAVWLAAEDLPFEATA